jgi:hypothetical protein
MSREAVEAGFRQFVEDVIDETVEEFSVARALRQGVRGPGGRIVDRLLKNSSSLRTRVVEPELATYRRRAVEQFEVVLDYVESDEPFEVHADRILAADSYWEALRPDLSAERKATVREALLARNRELGDAVAPLVAAPADEFWVAVRDTFDEPTAIALVEEQFIFTGPLREHRDAFVLETSFEPADVLGGVGGLLGAGLPTVHVEFTDEGIRAMRRAEAKVVEATKRRVRRQFD